MSDGFVTILETKKDKKIIIIVQYEYDMCYRSYAKDINTIP